MSYTPQLGSAVTLGNTGDSYTPPAGNAIVLTVGVSAGGEGDPTTFLAADFAIEGGAAAELVSSFENFGDFAIEGASSASFAASSLAIIGRMAAGSTSLKMRGKQLSQTVFNLHGTSSVTVRSIGEFAAQWSIVSGSSVLSNSANGFPASTFVSCESLLSAVGVQSVQGRLSIVSASAFMAEGSTLFFAPPIYGLPGDEVTVFTPRNQVTITALT